MVVQIPITSGKYVGNWVDAVITQCHSKYGEKPDAVAMAALSHLEVKISETKNFGSVNNMAGKTLGPVKKVNFCATHRSHLIPFCSPSDSIIPSWSR